MALTTEELELIMRVQGAADVDRLKESLAAQDKTLRELNDAYVKGLVTQQQFETQARRTVAGIVQGNIELKEAQKAAGQLTYEMQGANTALRNFGFGLSDVFSNNGPLGQKIQGFANNVGQITTGILQQFGKLGPGGIAAAAGLEIAFTATGAALTAMGIKSVDDLVRAFTGGTKNAQDRLAELQDRIKELENKKVKVSADVIELEHARDEADKLKKNLEAIEELRTGQTAAERESGKRIKEDLTEGGGQDALNEMIKQEKESQLRASQVRQEAVKDRDEAQQTIADLTAPGRRSGPGDANRQASAEKALAAANESLRMIQIAAQQAAEAKVGEDIRQAESGTGSEQLAAQRSLRQRLTNAGEGNTARRMAQSTPADVKEGEELERQMKDRDQEVKRRNEAAAEAKREAAEAKQAAREEASDAAKDIGQMTREELATQKEEADMAKRVAGASVREIKEIAPKAVHGANVHQADRELQGNIARGIQQETGANPMEAAVAAQRSIHLQNQGVNHIAATQQAVHELMNGMLALDAKMQHLSAGTHELGKRANEVTAKMRTNLSRTGN